MAATMKALAFVALLVTINAIVCESRVARKDLGLPKLVRATIAIGHALLGVVNNVKFLHIDWVEGLEVIKRCPNLQILDIDMV